MDVGVQHPTMELALAWGKVRPLLQRPLLLQPLEEVESPHANSFPRPMAADLGMDAGLLTCRRLWPTGRFHGIPVQHNDVHFNCCTSKLSNVQKYSFQRG
jgi:hypothetical protein